MWQDFIIDQTDHTLYISIDISYNWPLKVRQTNNKKSVVKKRNVSGFSR